MKKSHSSESGYSIRPIEPFEIDSTNIESSLTPYTPLQDEPPVDSMVPTLVTLKPSTAEIMSKMSKTHKVIKSGVACGLKFGLTAYVVGGGFFLLTTGLREKNSAYNSYISLNASKFNCTYTSISDPAEGEYHINCENEVIEHRLKQYADSYGNSKAYKLVIDDLLPVGLIVLLGGMLLGFIYGMGKELAWCSEYPILNDVETPLPSNNVSGRTSPTSSVSDECSYCDEFTNIDSFVLSSIDESNESHHYRGSTYIDSPVLSPVYEKSSDPQGSGGKDYVIEMSGRRIIYEECKEVEEINHMNGLRKN